MRRNRETYDVIVIGGGAVGLATARSIGERGLSVAVLEQHFVMNPAGSSGGDSRQWRIQYSHSDMTRLALQARSYWARLEEGVDTKLIHPVGSLWFGDRALATNEGELDSTIKVMDELEISFEALSSREIQARFPFRNLDNDFIGILQPDGGMIDVQATLWTLAKGARDVGATILEGQRAEHVEFPGDGVEVIVGDSSYLGAGLVIAAGCETDSLLREIGVIIEVITLEMAVAYFRAASGEDFPTWFAFQSPDEEGEQLYYGFPPTAWAMPDYVKVAPNFASRGRIEPSDRNWSPDPRDMHRLSKWVDRHLVGVDPVPVGGSTCLITLPLDPVKEHFLDLINSPAAANVAFYSSGWGFKFVPILGEILADLVISGQTMFDISRFSLPDQRRVS